MSKIKVKNNVIPKSYSSAVTLVYSWCVPPPHLTPYYIPVFLHLEVSMGTSCLLLL